MNRKYYLDEKWLPIQGYEGLYDVSNYGRIRSHDYRKRGVTQILRTHASKGYYVKVGLRKYDYRFPTTSTIRTDASETYQLR